MINVENIHFKYKREKEVISNLNLKINEGECIAIVGRNGSGKSTLARLISGIIKPTKGNIIVDEINTKDKNNYINLRKKIGVVFQNPENQILFNNIEDELTFALKNLGLEDRDIRINQALEKVKIEKEKIGDIDELSLGQKQRIAIAGVLAVNPKYIVLDEPTTMIDSEGKEAVYSIIKTLKNSGYTIIYITNNTEEIFLADRIIILDEGKIAETILKEDLVNKTEILSNYNLKIPIETLILKMLNENNIKINPAEPGVYGIIKELIRRVKV